MITQPGRAACASGATGGRTADWNWRSLFFFFQAEDGIRDGDEDTTADGLPVEDRQEEQGEQDQEAVLAEDGPKLPGRLSGHDREQDRARGDQHDGDHGEAFGDGRHAFMVPVTARIRRAAASAEAPGAGRVSHVVQQCRRTRVDRS